MIHSLFLYDPYFNKHDLYTHNIHNFRVYLLMQEQEGNMQKMNWTEWMRIKYHKQDDLKNSN